MQHEVLEETPNNFNDMDLMQAIRQRYSHISNI